MATVLARLEASKGLQLRAGHCRSRGGHRAGQESPLGRCQNIRPRLTFGLLRRLRRLSLLPKHLPLVFASTAREPRPCGGWPLRQPLLRHRPREPCGGRPLRQPLLRHRPLCRKLTCRPSVRVRWRRTAGASLLPCGLSKYLALRRTSTGTEPRPSCDKLCGVRALHRGLLCRTLLGQRPRHRLLHCVDLRCLLPHRCLP